MELDQIDHHILELLRSDGRMATRDIANRLSLSESTVRSHMRRLKADDSVRIVAVADFSVFGFNVMLSIAVDVQGRPVEEVAKKLSSFSQILSCNLVVGRHDIDMVAAVESAAGASELVRKIGEVEGVHAVSTGLISEILKYQVDSTAPELRGFLDAFHAGENDIPAGSTLDATNLDILRHLWRDARMSNQKIASELNVSEGTIRGRIKKMMEDGAIRIQAISNMDVSDRPVPMLALLGLKVDPKQVNATAQTLCDLKQSGFVATLLGRYDIMVLLFAESRAQLSELFLTHVRSMPSVREVEAFYPIQFAKFDYRFGRVEPDTDKST